MVVSHVKYDIMNIMLDGPMLRSSVLHIRRLTCLPYAAGGYIGTKAGLGAFAGNPT
jgi:hypothetical protein